MLLSFSKLTSLIFLFCRDKLNGCTLPSSHPEFIYRLRLLIPVTKLFNTWLCHCVLRPWIRLHNITRLCFLCQHSVLILGFIDSLRRFSSSFICSDPESSSVVMEWNVKALPHWVRYFHSNAFFGAVILKRCRAKTPCTLKAPLKLLFRSFVRLRLLWFKIKFLSARPVGGTMLPPCTFLRPKFFKTRYIHKFAS